MTSATSLRERKIAETSRRLTDLARAWTVERGFGSFTIEELCEEAGVSRRTFFNYFATKEDAVLGIPSRGNHEEAEARFLVGAGECGPSGLSTALLSDLAELMLARWQALGLGVGDFEALVAAIEHAPRVLRRMLQTTREQEFRDIALVEQRERLSPGDLRASTVVHLLGTILRGAVEETVCGSGESLPAVFARRIAAARSVFSA